MAITEAERLALEVAGELEAWLRERAERTAPGLAPHVAIGAAGIVYRHLLAELPAPWRASVDAWTANASAGVVGDPTP